MTLLPFIALVFVTVLSLCSCQQALVPATPSVPQSEKTTPVVLRLPIVQVGRETLVESLVLPGFVLALPDRSVKVSPAMAGKLIDIKVSSGCQVKKGQVIAVIDARQLTNQVNQAHAKVLVANAGVQQAKTGLMLAQNTADRNARLVAQEVGAEKDLVAARSQVETAKAQVLAAEAQVEDAKAAEAAARAQLTFAEVKSPITGLVAQRYLNISDSADPATPIMQIVNLDQVIVDASLPTSQPANVVHGQVAAITANALPGLKVTGIVQNINAVTDNLGTTVGVRILCDNPRHELREGMPVVTTVKLSCHPGALTVPVSALVPDPGDPDKKMVYVFKDGKVKRQPVRSGIQNNSRIEILSGLSPGESVVSGGAYGIPDGTEVEAESEPLHANSKVTSKSN
jgi:HlyD family secretion protein